MNHALSSELPDWVPLLVPDMPAPQALQYWLERMHSARQYSNFGPLVKELESNFANVFDIPQEQLTTVSNATQGLELVLQALDLSQGSRVLLPAFTFVASATAVVRSGNVPVLADVDAMHWMLTPEIARSVCATTRIDAVMPVATFGTPHDMRAWHQFELETGIPVVIDAAAAYGSQWLDGGEGTLVFSMHTTKSLPAGEGGLIVSSRPQLSAKVRQLSNFGINLDPHAKLPVGALAGMGTNAKMSEYHAAIALASLKTWDDHAKERQRLHAELLEELNCASGYRLLFQAQGNGGPRVAPTLMSVQLPDESARQRLEQTCEKGRIVTRRWYQPLLQDMPALRNHCHVLEAPNAKALGRTLLGLPFFLGMTLQQRSTIRDAVAQTFATS